jgi:hypothetical protein
MKNQGNMIPLKVHNSPKMESRDAEMPENTKVYIEK